MMKQIKMTIFCLITSGFCFLSPLFLMAKPSESDTLNPLPIGLQPANAEPSGGFGAALLQTIIALLFILGIIYLGVSLMRKFMNKPVLNQSQMFKSLGDYYLDSKKKLSLVQFEDRILILGITEHAVNLIIELDAQTDGKAFLDSLNKTQSSKISFENIFNQLRGKQKKHETS